MTKSARLNTMRHFLASLDYLDKDLTVIGEVDDPLIVGHASHVIHGSDGILGASVHLKHRHR